MDRRSDRLPFGLARKSFLGYVSTHLYFPGTELEIHVAEAGNSRGTSRHWQVPVSGKCSCTFVPLGGLLEVNTPLRTCGNAALDCESGTGGTIDFAR